MKRKVVVGGTFRDYQRYIRETGENAVYADRREKLLGLELQHDDVVRVGPVPWEIEEELKLRIRPVARDKQGDSK